MKQWDADKLGCVLETSWHSYRQTVVGSWQMLLDCPAARTSPVFFSLLLSLFFPSFLSFFPSLSLSPFFHCSPPSLLLWTSTSTLFGRTLFPSEPVGRNDRWKNHESVSLNPILTELERQRSRGNGFDTHSCMHAASSFSGEKRSFARTRERSSTWRSLRVHRADWSSFLTFPWLLPFFKGFFLLVILFFSQHWFPFI